jgi:hypothetical protein
MNHCPYVTSLDKPCGRDCGTSEHCAFHASLIELEREYLTEDCR